jgi:hypothetical protein
VCVRVCTRVYKRMYEHACVRVCVPARSLMLCVFVGAALESVGGDDRDDVTTDSASEGSRLTRAVLDRSGSSGSGASLTTACASLNRWVASLTTQYHDAIREIKATKAQMLRQGRELALGRATST